MRVSIFKIISLCLILFIIVIFFVALNIDKRYSTENIVGKKIDNFKIKFLFSDEVFKNEDFLNGEHYLINIWASWCLPCKKEHPILMKLSEEENLNLIGVNFKDKKNNAESFLKNLGNPYNVILSDADGTNSISFGVFGVPETILIDEKQIVIKKFVGPLDANDYKNIIKAINE
jgi:cytochrome c biogenesis protein CcmG/thiol:disulfide interchange protein DsbE